MFFVSWVKNVLNNIVYYHSWEAETFSHLNVFTLRMVYTKITDKKKKTLGREIAVIPLISPAKNYAWLHPS